MIRYDLICANGHAFDAWFSDSAGYERQAEAGLVECPVCGSADVQKRLMAPALASSNRSATPAADHPLLEHTRAASKLLRELHAHVRRHADYVGRAFPEEARKRALEEDARPIWGEASREEVRELTEEGISVLPLPPLPDEKN